MPPSLYSSQSISCALRYSKPHRTILRKYYPSHLSLDTWKRKKKKKIIYRIYLQNLSLFISTFSFYGDHKLEFLGWGSPCSHYLPSEKAFQFTKAWAYCWRGCRGIRWWFIIWNVFFSSSSVLDTWRATCISKAIWIQIYVELKFTLLFIQKGEWRG